MDTKQLSLTQELVNCLRGAPSNKYHTIHDIAQAVVDAGLDLSTLCAAVPEQAGALKEAVNQLSK